LPEGEREQRQGDPQGGQADIPVGIPGVALLAVVDPRPDPEPRTRARGYGREREEAEGEADTRS